MQQRKRLVEDSGGGGKYFDAPDSKLAFFSSGCTLLDCVLSGPRKRGGWAMGRVSNICGDSSTGKTLLAIEATANFAIQYPDKKKHKIRYREVEAAFDTGYAQTIGLDLSRVELPTNPVDTVEQFFEDLTQFVNTIPVGGAGFYILDSLDAIGDKDEAEGEFGQASYGTKKARLMGQLFRKVVRRMEKKNVHLMIISQLRDKIGVTFGEKQTRAGGRALQFYASQIIWLADLGKIRVTKMKVQRPIGNMMRVRCKKNKIAKSYRECDVPIIYDYGMSDIRAGVEWLAEVDMLNRMGVRVEKGKNAKKKAVSRYLARHAKLRGIEAKEVRTQVNAVVRKAWKEVEDRFAPPERKY